MIMHRRKSFRAAAAIFSLLSLVIAALGQAKAFDPANLDRAADACSDFYQFANGGWLKRTQIPPTESRWGTFNILADRNTEILHKVLEKASKTKSPRGTNQQLIGDYYATCIDEAAIERAGTKPIEPFLKEISSISTTDDLMRTIADLQNNGIPALFGFGGGPDLKNSNAVIVNASQGGLSLPNRDYYTNNDPKSQEIRERFKQYASKMFTLLGDDPDTANSNANKILEIQTRLANSSLTPVERRNPDNNYNKITLEEAQKLTPRFNWQQFLAERKMPNVSELNMAPPKFFREMDAMLSDVSISDWQVYLKWMVVNSAAESLPKAFADNYFDFYRRYLSGQKEQQPRWKRCVRDTDFALGEALGMEYAKLTFSPQAKARMNKMIDNLIAALHDRINNLEWMGPETKKQAQAKLAAFKRKIGYPDKLRGYKGLELKRDSYLANVLRIRAFEIKRNNDDIGKPRDKTRWPYSPSTVNASYSAVNNDITFPAGILQPPFFNFNADDAINYGAIGAVIGHEISHGFDDQGSRFDADGNLRMWWTKEDRQRFEERTACVVDQFNNYQVQPGLFINGKLTLGEKIGEFAGLTIAFDAFMRSLRGGKEPPKIDGFTAEQRFFLGWAQIWASKSTPEAERQQVLTDPHSAARWRVNGPLSNMPQFARAFGCKAGQPMVRQNACAVW